MSNFIFVFFNLLGGGVGLFGGDSGVEFGKFVGGKVVQCHEVRLSKRLNSCKLYFTYFRFSFYFFCEQLARNMLGSRKCAKS